MRHGPRFPVCFILIFDQTGIGNEQPAMAQSMRLWVPSQCEHNTLSIENYERVKGSIFLKSEKESKIGIRCITSCDVSCYKTIYGGQEESNTSGDSIPFKLTVFELNPEMLEEFIQVSWGRNFKRS